MLSSNSKYNVIKSRFSKSTKYFTSVFLQAYVYDAYLRKLY